VHTDEGCAGVIELIGRRMFLTAFKKIYVKMSDGESVQWISLD